MTVHHFKLFIANSLYQTLIFHFLCPATWGQGHQRNSPCRSALCQLKLKWAERYRGKWWYPSTVASRLFGIAAAVKIREEDIMHITTHLKMMAAGHSHLYD